MSDGLGLFFVRLFMFGAFVFSSLVLRLLLLTQA